jgi:hypothetical protein
VRRNYRTLGLQRSRRFDMLVHNNIVEALKDEVHDNSSRNSELWEFGENLEDVGMRFKHQSAEVPRHCNSLNEVSISNRMGPCVPW